MPGKYIPSRAARRRRLAVRCVALGALCAALLGGATARANVVLVPLIAATRPVYVTHAGDTRLFIVEKAGRIRIYDRSTRALLPTAFLDLQSVVRSTGSEQGLFSLAFHPDFASNGLFYVNYTQRDDSVATDGATVIERYQVDPANRDRALVSTAQRLLVIPQPFINHNGGQLQIGPDGYLYIGMGDGGDSFDPGCRAQTPGSLLGKMLRLDVRQNLNSAPYYGIPADNPFIGASDPQHRVPDEVWAFGLRNPWRFSFDRLLGHLYIADVGQNAFEEIDVQPAGTPGGRNYGWKLMEANACTNNSSMCPAGTPPCGSSQYTAPVSVYGHSVGCSITGGYVYRGTRAPELAGRYVFGDFCSGAISAMDTATFAVQAVAQGGLDGLTTFGEDAQGGLYAAVGNQIYELASDTPVPAADLRARLALGAGLLAAGAAVLRRRRSTAVPVPSPRKAETPRKAE